MKEELESVKKCYTLSMDNLPEKYISLRIYESLLHVVDSVGKQIKQLRTEFVGMKEGGKEALTAPKLADCLVRMWLAELTDQMAYRLFSFLAIDSRCHPLRQEEVFVLGKLQPDCPENEFVEHLRGVFAMVAVCNGHHKELPRNAIFAHEINNLRRVGDIFFSTVHNIFPIAEVLNCHNAFNDMMSLVGEPAACDAARDYVAAFKAMEHAIKAHEQQKARNDAANISQQVKSCIEDFKEDIKETIARPITKVTKAVRKMDRRQKEALKRITADNKSRNRALLRSGSLANDAQAAAMLKGDRYEEALAHYAGGRKKMLLTVIKYTESHPIEKRAKGTGLTLGKAVEAVWRKQYASKEATLKLREDVYKTCENLRAACYHLKANPATDVFTYKS